MLFIEAVVTEAEAEEAVRAFPGVPLLFNWAEGGKTPPISLDRLVELGIPDRHLPDQHAAGGDGRHAPDTAGDRHGRDAGRGDA